MMKMTITALVLLVAVASVCVEATPVTPTVCLEPKKTGTCKTVLIHFYFNQFKGKCEHFLYSGCGGNDNNFPTREKCEEICEPDNPIVS